MHSPGTANGCATYPIWPHAVWSRPPAASPCAQFPAVLCKWQGHSSQILWKRLWAMPLIRIKVLEFKGIFCCADFLGNRIQTPSNALARGRVLVYSHKLWKTMW